MNIMDPVLSARMKSGNGKRTRAIVLRVLGRGCLI